MINIDNQEISYISFLSHVGWLTLFEKSKKIISVEWRKEKNHSENPLLTEAHRQLTEYFNKERKNFTVPLEPTGTNFQKSVWYNISKIPYGKTNTYGEIAKKLNSAARAIGGACGKNPIPIFIPCHRVMGANDKLTGFSGGSGVKTKEALLHLETPVKYTINEFQFLEDKK